MFSFHPSTRRAFRFALAAAALAGSSALFNACTDSTSTPPPSSTAHAPSQGANPAEKAADGASKMAADAAKKGEEVAHKVGDAAKDTAAKINESAKDVAKKTVEAASDVAKKTGEAVNQVADKSKEMANDAKAKLAEAAKPAAPAPAPAKGDDVAAKAAAAAQQAMNEKAKLGSDAAQKGLTPEQQKLLTPEQQKALAAGHSADDGHDHAKPAFDPNNPDGAPDPNSKAKLNFEFGTDTKNFGKVLQGDVLNHTFELSSAGEEDLIIRQAKPTCGCTVAQIAVQGPEGGMVPYAYGNPIPVGRKVEIKATLHTVNKRGHAGSRINIFSNDPRGQTQLGLEAEVEPFFNINPAVINLNTLSAKDAANDKATISTAHGERVKLNAQLDNVPQGLKIELKPADADAEGKATRWDLNVVAGPGLVEGSLAYMVPLKSDLAIPGAEKLPNGQVPSYESSITVMARVTGMIEFTPAFVSLGLIRPGQTQSRTIRISSHDADFKVTEKILDSAVSVQGRDSADWEYAKCFTKQVRAVPNENAVDVEVTLTGMPESLSGSFSGMLVILTGYESKPEAQAADHRCLPRRRSQRAGNWRSAGRRRLPARP